MKLFDYKREPEYSNNDWVRAIYDFNRIRNGLKLNINKEVLMLDEELIEFNEAKTLADLIDSVLDTDYVFQGSKIKIAFNYRPDEDNTEFVNKYSKLLSERYDMLLVLLDTDDVANILRWSQKIIAHCNSLKTKKLDNNGKVVKGKIPNATDMIAEMLKERGIENITL